MYRNALAEPNILLVFTFPTALHTRLTILSGLVSQKPRVLKTNGTKFGGVANQITQETMKDAPLDLRDPLMEEHIMT